MKQWAFTRVSFMLCPWRQTPCQQWPLLPRKTVQRSVEIFKRGQCSRVSVQANKTRTTFFFALECLFSGSILHLTLICFCFQPLKYASSASLYRQEDGSPALSASTQSGVNNKVSAWLQQTHDIDATSNGQNCLYSWLTSVRSDRVGGWVQRNGSTDIFECPALYIFDISVCQNWLAVS